MRESFKKKSFLKESTDYNKLQTKFLSKRCLQAVLNGEKVFWGLQVSKTTVVTSKKNQTKNQAMLKHYN